MYHRACLPVSCRFCPLQTAATLDKYLRHKDMLAEVCKQFDCESAEYTGEWRSATSSIFLLLSWSMIPTLAHRQNLALGRKASTENTVPHQMKPINGLRAPDTPYPKAKRAAEKKRTTTYTGGMVRVDNGRDNGSGICSSLSYSPVLAGRLASAAGAGFRFPGSSCVVVLSRAWAHDVLPSAEMTSCIAVYCSVVLNFHRSVWCITRRNLPAGAVQPSHSPGHARRHRGKVFPQRAGESVRACVCVRACPFETAVFAAVCVCLCVLSSHLICTSEVLRKPVCTFRCRLNAPAGVTQTRISHIFACCACSCLVVPSHFPTHAKSWQCRCPCVGSAAPTVSVILCVSRHLI